MITLHPSITKASRGGFKPVVLLRSDTGACVGHKVSSETYADKDEARTVARHLAHVAARAITVGLPAFPVRVA